MCATATGTAISSSTEDDKSDKWGPQFAIDGLWPHTADNLFVSKTENTPWLQWRLPRSQTHLAGIVISNPNNGDADSLKNVEVRAGNQSLESDFKGEITINQLCGKFDGPGGKNRVYTIMCTDEIVADYITIQIKNKNAKLQLNEIELVTISRGR